MTLMASRALSRIVEADGAASEESKALHLSVSQPVS